jgi:hypothetical protein
MRNSQLFRQPRYRLSPDFSLSFPPQRTILKNDWVSDCTVLPAIQMVFAGGWIGGRLGNSYSRGDSIHRAGRRLLYGVSQWYGPRRTEGHQVVA